MPKHDELERLINSLEGEYWERPETKNNVRRLLSTNPVETWADSAIFGILGIVTLGIGILGFSYMIYVLATT